MKPSLLSILFVLISWIPSYVYAQPSEQTVYQITHEVSNEILSPFCPGKSLAMCPSPAAADARRAIQALAEKGLSKEEIKDEIVEQFGPEFRRITPGIDDNLIILALIVVGLLLCGGFVFLLSKKSKNSTVVEEESTMAGDDDDLPDDYVQELRDVYRN